MIWEIRSSNMNESIIINYINSLIEGALRDMNGDRCDFLTELKEILQRGGSLEGRLSKILSISEDLATALLENNFTFGEEEKAECLFRSICRRYDGLFDVLIQKNTSVHFVYAHPQDERNKETTILAAIRRQIDRGDAYEILKTLIEKGVQISKPAHRMDDDPLTLASSHAQLSIVEMLCEADLPGAYLPMDQALFSAINVGPHESPVGVDRENRLKVIDYLISKGANVNARNNLRDAAWGYNYNSEDSREYQGFLLDAILRLVNAGATYDENDQDAGSIELAIDAVRRREQGMPVSPANAPYELEF